MTTAIHLAGPDAAPQVLTLAAQFHAETGVDMDDAHRVAALGPLLEGSPLGAVYLFGPQRAPVGYLVVSFGWSLEMGGMDAFLDELFIRPSVRGRGIGTEVLMSIARALGGAGVMALHLEVARDAPDTQRLYEKAGFDLRGDKCPMTRRL